MKNPFKIFPSIGYKNSQFQIISTVDNLTVEFYQLDKFIRSVEVNSHSPTLLTSLDGIGKIAAKCYTKKTFFEQEIEIIDALRLGSSELKKAFVFDNCNFSFFLMKDRLLIFDEANNLIHSENHYSPSEIYQIDKDNFLFVTNVGSTENGIINLGIYNTEEFSLIGELLNEYREVKIIPNSKVVWLHNINSNYLYCYELIDEFKNCFKVVKKINYDNEYYINEDRQFIIFNNNKIVGLASLTNPKDVIEIVKIENTAIDRAGNIYIFEKGLLTCRSLIEGYSHVIKFDKEIRFKENDFFYLGQGFIQKEKNKYLTEKIFEIRETVLKHLSDDTTEHNYPMTDGNIIVEFETLYEIRHTKNGVYIIESKVERKFVGFKFNRESNDWKCIQNVNEKRLKSLFYYNNYESVEFFSKVQDIAFDFLQNQIVVLEIDNNKIIFNGKNRILINRADSYELFVINAIEYFLIETNRRFSLYRSNDPNQPLLSHIEILNFESFKKHGILWYRDKKANRLTLDERIYQIVTSGSSEYEYELEIGISAFNLINCKKVNLEAFEAFKNIPMRANQFVFHNDYAFFDKRILFNPKNFEVKDVILGELLFFSVGLNKIVSQRGEKIYLSKFDFKKGKYELSEVLIEKECYSESYLSPNGKYLVLKDDSNEYLFYDLESGKISNFFSGIFLAFNSESCLIVKDNLVRNIKIIDPLTFQEISSSNYEYYKFTSPDGKLYADMSSKTGYFDLLKGELVSNSKAEEIYKNFGNPSNNLNSVDRRNEQIRIDNNRKNIFTEFQEKFKERGIFDPNRVTPETVIMEKIYVEVGITGTNEIVRICLPDDTHYYNYSAFSHDNQFIGIVGNAKANSYNMSLIMICRLSFNEYNHELKVVDTFISRLPDRAAWVCGFSKTGYFATYDSNPNTYIIEISNLLFSELTSDFELKQNIFKKKINTYYTYKLWKVIKGKNFLSFSPSGNYLAMSEQGYDPLTLGGYGHQESNVVHLANTESGVIVDSFTGHGDKIQKKNNVFFVAFSKDEKKLMTLSSDGVVIIRNLNLDNKIPKSQIINNIDFVVN